MFSLKVADTDSFLDMPQTAQNLYFHLGLRADDDGFIANPRRIMKMLGSSDDDYKLLLVKRFIIQFDSGICVIKHWRIHNYLQNDRYIETQYVREKELLEIDQKTKKYILKSEKEANVYIPYTQLNLTKLNYNNNSDKSPTVEETIKEETKEIKPLKSLYEQLGVKQNIRKIEKWQDSASIAIKELNVPEEKISSVFKCFKDNEREAMLALSDCKELGKMNVFYFLKVYSEIVKKIKNNEKVINS